MAHVFARKLSLTAVLLGCGTRKELCARFRSVNPMTEVDLERSFKWLQGRALPRSPTVYDDWARLIGTQRSGTWIAACSEEAFLDEICAIYGADRNDLQLRAMRFLGDGAAASGTADALLGQYVAYSWAWSPFHLGELIRGRFVVTEAGRGRLEVVYTEEMPGLRIEMSGLAARSGRVLHCNLTARGDEQIDFLLLASGRPLDTLVGLMQGQTISAADLQIASSRIVLFRTVGAAAGGGMESCYLSADAGVLAQDLRKQQVATLAPGLAETTLDFLRRQPTGGMAQVNAADLARFLSVAAAQA